MDRERGFVFVIYLVLILALIAWAINVAPK